MPRIIIPRTKISKESFTTKRSLIFVGLTAICGGYILFLAIAAPEQLAEATTAATDVVCSGCVGSTDIGTGQVRSVDIGDGQVASQDIGTGQVRSVDIGDGQVGSVDIGTGQVASVDIQDNTITSADLGNVISIVQGQPFGIGAGASSGGNVDCPSGKILTGGGFLVSGDGADHVRVTDSHPEDANTWVFRGFNGGTSIADLHPYALCV
jgi:hypothetical protein